jgi:hypothetical protein
MAAADTVASAEADDQVVNQTEGFTEEGAEGFTFDMGATTASSGFPLIPPGVYPGVIEACDFSLSKNSGNPMWTIKWGFESGEYAQKNRKMRSYVIFSAEQLGRAKMFLKRIAPELAELTDFNPKTIAESQVMIGKRGRMKINTQKGQNGEDQSNVADVLEPTAGGSTGEFTL